MMRVSLIIAVAVMAWTQARAQAPAAPDAPPTGIALVAAPVDAAEQALVDALITRLQNKNVPLRAVVRTLAPDAPTPDGRLDVRFDRTDGSVAVWLDWRGPRDSRGWAARVDALTDADADAKALVTGIQTRLIARGQARSGTGRAMRVDRTDRHAMRVALAYNGAGMVWGVHQVEGELRWSDFAVGLGYSYSSWGGEETRSLDNPRYREALSGTTHGLRADGRWYGDAARDWYLYAGGRLLLDRAVLRADFDEVEVDGTALITTAGFGTYWGEITGLYIGARAGVPFFATSSADNYGRTTTQTLVLGFDVEFSAGIRF